jgi:hypothetical protein
MTYDNAFKLARRGALALVALGLLSACSSGAAHAQDRAQADRAALVARLDSLANGPVQEGRAAGISVAVVHGRDTLLKNLVRSIALLRPPGRFRAAVA